MKFWKRASYCAGVTMALGLTACESSRVPVTGTGDLTSLRDALSSRRDSVAEANKSETSFTDQAVVTRGLEGNQCVTWTRHHDRNAVEEISLYDINADSLWVGNLVHAKDATRGILNPIRAMRAPLTVSIQGRARHKNGEKLGRAEHQMQSPAASEYENARANLVGSGFEPAGGLACQTEEAFSAEQAAFNLRADMSKLSFSLKADLSRQTENKSRIVTINCTQPLYRIVLDEPSSKEKFFDPRQNVGDLLSAIEPDDSIAYVSSIHYGKRIIVIVKTNESASSIRASVEAKVSALAGKGSASSDLLNSDSFQSSDFKVFAAGHSSEDIRAILGANKQIRVDQLGEIFGKESEDRLVTYGAPLAYTLRFLSSARNMKLLLVGDYETPSYRDPSAPILNDVRLSVRMGDDDADNNTSLIVYRPDGQAAMFKPVRGDDLGVWHDHAEYRAHLGPVSADQLIGDWKVIVRSRGDDNVEFSLKLTAENEKRLLAHSTMYRIESSERNNGQAREFRVSFPYQPVYSGTCQLNSEEQAKASRFESRHNRITE